MKHLLFSALFSWIALGMFSCNNSSQASPNDHTNESTEMMQTGDNTLTQAQKKEGWKLLFDGKTTEGWHTFNEDQVSSRWKAMDGKLIYNPKDETGKGGDLVTNEEFENYHLKVDWNISDCGNSGLIFNVQETGQEKTYHTGPEMQILDNTCHSDAKYPTHRAGSLYDFIQAQPETVKPAGEWNTSEIILDHGSLTFLLNGTKVVETQMFNDKWKDMIANNKFKQWPGFGTFKKGHIALQDHGNGVEFKNMMIREL